VHLASGKIASTLAGPLDIFCQFSGRGQGRSRRPVLSDLCRFGARLSADKRVRPLDLCRCSPKVSSELRDKKRESSRARTTAAFQTCRVLARVLEPPHNHQSLTMPSRNLKEQHGFCRSCVIPDQPIQEAMPSSAECAIGLQSSIRRYGAREFRQVFVCVRCTGW
jgi:hypothetical protein